MNTVGKNKSLKKEVSFKIKHGISWILIVLAFIIFIMGISFYKMRDKVDFYLGISKQVRSDPLSSCTTKLCVLEEIAKHNYSLSDCEKTPFKDVCISQIYKKNALSSGSKDKCAKITLQSERDSCYLSLAITYHNPSYCTYIKDGVTKEMCVNMFSKKDKKANYSS